MNNNLTKQDLLNYIEMFNQYDQNKVKFSKEQLSQIQKISNQIKTNKELHDFMVRVQNANVNDRKKMIEDYYSNLEEKKPKSNEEEIAKQFGIDVSKIEHRYLKNGKEIFHFYDPKSMRDVVLENRKDGSLVEQLKEMQAENEKYQTNSNEKNTYQMLNDQNNSNDIEVKMVPLNELSNHMNQINGLKKDEYRKLQFIINNAIRLNISYINIENQIGIDSSGKLLETLYDKEKDEFSIGEPGEAIYNENNIDMSNRVDSNLENTQNLYQVNANDNYQTDMNQTDMYNEYEDKPDEYENPNEDKTEVYENLTEEEKERVQMYANYRELLEHLEPAEKEKYQAYIESYERYLEKQEQIRKQDKPKEKVYKDNKKAGYVSALLLFLFTGFVGGVLATLLTIALGK